MLKKAREHFSSIDSTNTWAKRNATSLQRDAVTLVTADEQTAGRGRFSRKWISPPAQNIYASFCFFVEKRNLSQITSISQILAVAAAETLDACGFTVAFKWPNDLMLSGKKVAGILCETTSIEEALCVIAGIGINVNMQADVMQQIDRPVTSLYQESGIIQDRSKIELLLEKHFLLHLEQVLEFEQLRNIIEIYRQRILHRKGEQMRFHDGQVVQEGLFDSIAEDGSLNLRLASGDVKNFLAGELC